MKKYRALFIVLLSLLLSLMLLTGCIRITSEEPVSSPASTAVIATNIPATSLPQATLAPTEALSTETPSATVIALPQPSSLPALQLSQRWQFSVTDTVADLDLITLDGGPLPDIVAVGRDQQVYALGVAGNDYWIQTQSASLKALAVADLNGNEVGEAVIGGDDNQITVIEGGAIRWQYDLTAPVITILWINDEASQLVVATDDGRLTGLNEAGERLWTWQEGQVPITQLMAADLNESPASEIIALDEAGTVMAFSPQGDLLWQVANDKRQVMVADLTGNGRSEVVMGNMRGELVVYSATREPLWQQQVEGSIVDLASVDLDGDGRLEVSVGSNQGTGLLTTFTAEGHLLWQVSLTDSVHLVVAGQVDGDGVADLIVGSQTGLLTMLDGNGRFRGSYSLGQPLFGLRLADMDQGVNSPFPEFVIWSEQAIHLLDVQTEVIATEQADAVTTVPTTPVASVETSSPSVQPIGNLPHYQLQVDLDYNNHFLAVEETVTIRNTAATPWSEVVFNVSAAYWPDVFTLKEAQVIYNHVSQEATLDWQDSTILQIPLPQPLASNDVVTITFVFDLSLPSLNPTGWGPEGNAGWGPDLVQLGDWYPVLVPYDSGAGWRSWAYTPVGDPMISRLANYDVTITTAPDVLVAAAGRVDGNNGVHRYHLEEARAFAFLASPNYIRYEGEAAGVPIQVFVTDTHQTSGLIVLETVGKSITHFVELFGPFPYPEFVIAENGFLTSNEYSGFVSLGGFAFDSYGGGADSLLVSITAHEVAHQWWYGAVGNDQVNEPWLDEALAMFGELSYYERYHPDLVDWWWQFRVDRWTPTGFVDVSIYEYADSPSFVHDMYGQSAHFLQDLREAMGEEAFKTFLRDYYQQNINQFATTDHFLNLAQTHSASDLSSLIQQYFKSDG